MSDMEWAANNASEANVRSLLLGAAKELTTLRASLQAAEKAKEEAIFERDHAEALMEASGRSCTLCGDKLTAALAEVERLKGEKHDDDYTRELMDAELHRFYEGRQDHEQTLKRAIALEVRAHSLRADLSAAKAEIEQLSEAQGAYDQRARMDRESIARIRAERDALAREVCVERRRHAEEWAMRLTLLPAPALVSDRIPVTETMGSAFKPAPAQDAKEGPCK